MNTTAKKRTQAKFPRRKIYSVVLSVLPKGRKFTLQVIDSHIGKMKVVRIVTPTWKRLRPSDRIDRIIRAANKRLTAGEQKNILRFSVLTPDEYSKIRPRAD
jgi:alkylated DNA nucleotide flippase Atl1